MTRASWLAGALITLASLVAGAAIRPSNLARISESEGKVARIAPDLYYASAAAEEAKQRLAEHCLTHGEITAATFRDLIDASRKFAIAFLDWCDRTGVTVRVGDLRKLRTPSAWTKPGAAR